MAMAQRLAYVVVCMLTILSVAVSQNPPTFPQGTYSATINQNALAGDRLVTVPCSSESATIIYHITSSAPAEIASINASTGVVSLIEDGINLSGNYAVSLLCVDSGGASATALLEIARIEENEHLPIFLVGDTIVNISESRNIEANPFVANFTATDADLGTFGTVTYSLEGSQSSGFAVNAQTGRVTLTASLDYETNPVHLFLVRASNPATESALVLSSAVRLEVRVADVNDELPMFGEASYSAIVQETTDKTPRPGPGFLVVNCTDRDSDDSDITYATLSDSGPFVLDSVTGSFSLTEDLDYETTTSYSFTIGCWDNGSPNLTSSTDVNILVGSVNEYRPVITSSTLPTTITEGEPTGTIFFNVTAEDEDSGPDGMVTYTLTLIGDEPQLIDIHLTTGSVFVSAEELDFELLDLTFESDTFFRYEFSITACDTHPPTPVCETDRFIVFILGVNEYPPEFTEESYVVTYCEENTLVGTLITTAFCSDKDRGTGRFCGIEFDETVGSDVTDTFFIDEMTGEVISTAPLDYETQTKYGFEVVCRDAGNNGRCDGSGGMTDRATIEIVVEPLNDNLPFFTQSAFQFNVSRTTPADRRTVGVASASDADVDEGGDLQFTIESNGFFDITDNGNIQIFNSVSNYSENFLSMTVDVTDGENNDSALVVIFLTEGNHNRPQFVPGSRVIEVSELSPVDTSVISLSCEDSDTGVNGDIRYSIVNGNTNSVFKVDRLTGEVSVRNILVLPQNVSQENYLLTIVCEDRGVPVFFDQEGVLIRVYQDDSLPPAFPNDTVIAFVSEDAALSDLVVTVEAIDLDSEQLAYRLEDQSIPGVFTIGISTGEVVVSALLDRETTSVYTMTVVATEERETPGPERSDNASLVIFIRDVNDNTPTCLPTSPTAFIQETLAVGGTVLELNCSDPDTAENGAIEYSLTNDFGVLAIDSLGLISLNESLSETDQNTLVLEIVVSDKGSDPNQRTVRATVFISSVNRNVPSFTNIPATVRVSEAQAIQTVFFTVSAEDPDRGSFGQVTYGIFNSTSSDDIGIFSNTGGVYLNRKLDYFSRNEYTLNVSAADSDFTVYAELTIEVLDANEFSPECEQPSITSQIREGLSAGQLLTPVLSCTDEDLGSNGNIVFEIVSGYDDSAFQIHPNGSLTTLQVLDYDNGVQRYTLTVNVSDSGSPAESVDVTVVIVVEAVNEFSPEIEGSPHSVSVVENSGIGFRVLQLNVSDGDNPDHAHGQLDYEIEGLSDPVFQFTGSGEMQVAGNIDREEKSSYNFTVTVSDQGNPPLSAETSVMVTVTDLDDNPPEFTEDIYVAVLNGTAEEGASVVTVECTDEDEGVNAGIEYELIASGDAQFFTIDVGGMILVDDDLPVSDLYSISVTCIGTGPGDFSDTTVVSIQVLVDSNITFFPSSSYSLVVMETSVSGEELLTVEANSSTGAELFFDLVTSDNPFSIGETTGVLQLRGVLDYETTQTYTVQVRASDNGSPPNFGDAVIQISVENINDETPVISTEPATLTIAEGDGLILPHTLAEYQCSDSDDGVFGDVQFAILSGNADNLFSISLSGTLQLLRHLDYELAQSHSLEVVCEDGGLPPNTDTITVPITVTPINDHPPLFPTASRDISVTENLPPGSQVGTPIAATDGDLPPHGDIRYSLIGGNEPRTFALSAETGQLSLAQSLDYETTLSYSLLILAEDSGGQVDPDWSVLNDTIVVMVTVLDYNDNSPHFEHDTYSGTISETARNGDQVVVAEDISCTDQDSGENGETSLAILEESPFTVENSGLVLVSMSQLLDFEVDQFYILPLACLDGGTPQLMTTVNLVITVQDVNEFGPEFNSSSYSFSVPESTVVGRSVGQVFASDLDAGEAGAISYSIVTADVPFNVDPDSGAVVVASSLDYETQSTTYILRVVASDASSLSDTATVIVAIENEDDNVPGFTQAVYYSEVRENSPVDTPAGEVSCMDADDSADGVPISYAIDSSVDFSIDTNGRLSVAGGLDLEHTPRHTFRINCTDSALNTAQATVSINILPFNDFSPRLQGDPPYSTSLAENPSLGTHVFQVEALDDDLIAYNDITYSFSAGNEAGRFAIDPSSGAVTTAEEIDREVQAVYVLDVVARNDIPAGDESGSPSLSATTTLTITVTDINDNTPSVTPDNVTVILQVSMSVNATVIDLDCSDRDTGVNGETEFLITSDQFAERFEISESGQLTTVEAIEEDVVVVVTCSDNGTPRRSSSARIVIETVSMNEHDPVFQGATVRTISVREDAGIGEEIECFTAMDADGQDSPDGTLAYSLAVEGSDTRFSIQRSTGCLFVALQLDYDETNFYLYTLTAEDMGDPPRSASITLHITVLDTVRDPPVVQGTYTRSIPETLGGGTHIVDFRCEDSDDQDVVVYSIIGGNTDGLFVIDMESGRIDVAQGQELDYETRTSYALLVQCTDTHNLTDSANVFVTLTPVNEFTPSFEATEYRVPEHSIGGTVVANLRWEDLDSERDGEVDFEILSGDPEQLFEVTSSAQLLVRGDLDRETDDHYELEIRISDQSSTEERSSVNNVSVVLTDINDNRPEFEQEVYQFGPLQGSEEVGFFLGVVSCTDSDLGSNAATSYGISSTSSDANLFAVNSTGHVSVRGNLTHRVFDNITFFIQCTDSGPIPMSGTALAIVPVSEENLFPPVFSSDEYSTVVPENTPIISEVLLTVAASDMDRGVNGRVRYSLKNDFDNTFFIDDTTGELSLLRSLDFEETTYYRLVAMAADGSPDSTVSRSDLTNITVNVTGVNEFSPYCPDPIYVTIINKTTTGEIVDLGCVDDDSGSDGELRYVITSGNEDGHFVLSSHGVVGVPVAIEPNEEMEQYALNINVSDMGQPGRVTEVEVIAIYSFDNLDDPDFNQSEYFITVSESTEVGVVIATLTAVDNDPSLQGQLEYSLEGVSEFRIDSETGQLFLSSPLDYEEVSTLSFVVVAQDSDPYSPMSGTAVVTVAVSNDNDNTPECSRLLYTATTLNTASVGETLLTLNCSDRDGNPITYSLTTPLSGFDVDSPTGEVGVAGSLVAGTTTVFDVSVTDGMRSIEVTVSVRVRFSNTEPPVFTHSHFNFTVSEDAPLLVDVGSLTASDEDSSDLTFSADLDLTEFYISPESGEVLLTVPLDYETTTDYEFEVVVADEGSHDGTNRLTDTATVTILVQNTNDNLPQFSDGGIYGAVVSKSTEVDTDVLTITCTDLDDSPYGSPEVTSEDFSSDIPFTLVQDGPHYTVQVAEPLLDSVSASYFINITCTDGGGEREEGQVFIFVPEPDAPSFSETIYEWLLSENTATGEEFDDIMATSSDMSDVLYDIADGNPDDVFYIDPTTGVVSLVTSLDYETQRTHGLIIRARDGQDRESRVLLLVMVLDINDQVPLTPPSARLEVLQNSPVGTPVGTLHCSDGETGEGAALNFTFIPASDLFSVDQFGIVRLEEELDATPVHVLPVICSEVEMPELVSTGVVTVEVVFVNEDSPNFDLLLYVFSIAEDVSTLMYVGTVEAEDSDVGSFGEVNYYISDGNPDQFFIEASTGRIGVLTALDRETIDSYTLTISAVDGGAAASDTTRKTGTTVVEILVEDANDNTPAAEFSSYVESITTDHVVHSPVLSVVCSDADLGSAGDIVYSLDPPSVPFSVQSNGTILLDAPQPHQTVYTYDVVCTDRGTPVLSSSALVTVIVSALELEAPVFDSTSYNVTVSENEPILTTILRVQATPSDPSVEIVYQLQSGNEGNHFQVDPSTGDVLIRNLLDASERQQYTLTVRATNAGRNPLSSFATVDVSVTDINDHSPVFSSPFYAAAINETAPLLTPVVQLSCTDEDITADITYSIRGGHGEPPVFNITQGGLVVTSGEVDYELETVYDVVVVCSDGGPTPRSAEATVRIEVEPVNEFLPVFSQLEYQFSAVEGSFGAVIGTLMASDGDAGSQGDITYLLQDPGNFSVVFVGPETGQVLVSSNLDYESRTFWNLTVIARDGGGAESFVPLLVAVVNVNDVLPEVSPATSVATIPHDTVAGYPVQTYSCTDGDNTLTSLSIASGNDLGYFALTSSSQLVWTGAAEGDNLLTSIVVSLSLECRDEEAGEGQSTLAYTAVTIQVGDILPPLFGEERYEVSLPEDSEVGVSIVNVTAVSGGHDIEYSLSELFSSLPFGVDPLTGIVSLTSQLNRENSSQYVFPLHARDMVTGAVGVALVAVTVTDVNDNVPVITPDTQVLSLSESMLPGLPFTVFQCSDIDEGNNGTTSFSLIPPDPFRINQGGQLSIFNPLNFEDQSQYNITVVCSDQGMPPLSATANVLIEVTGTNEHPPIFSSDSFTFNMTEAALQGTLVGVVSASDSDTGAGEQLQFEFVGGDGVPHFTINSLGEIRTMSVPTNATRSSSLHLVVEVSDGLLSSTAVVTVNVADVNESPQFPSRSVVALWYTSEPVGESVVKVTCFDTDTPPNAAVVLSLHSNPSSLPLIFTTIGSDRVVVGDVIANGTISAGVYILSLLCTDGTLNTTADVTLRVEGVNIPPEFDHGDLFFSLSESTSVGTPLVGVAARDPEGTRVTYAITSGTGLGTFGIDQISGVVSLVLSLDYEVTSEYQLTVTATDSSRFDRESSSIGIVVYVQNVNDVPPTLAPDGIIVLTLPEDSSPMTHVRTFECVDPEGSPTSLSLSPAYHAIDSPFAISNSAVLLQAELDYERERDYLVTVTCTDTVFTGGDEIFQQSSILIIHVTPVNIFSPVFVSPVVFEVREDAEVGEEVGRVNAIDADNRVGPVISYTLLTHLDTFVLGSESGVITLREKLDFESISNYSLSVEASDNDNVGVTPRTTVTDITVLVSDTNDNSPLCVQYLINVVVLTGTYDDHLLARLLCSDEDSSNNGLLVYSFIPSTLPTFENGRLHMNPSTGELRFSGSLTQVQTVVVDVNVSDSGTPRHEARVILTIQIQTSSLTEPRFNTSTFNITIDEDTPIDTVIFPGSTLLSSLHNPNNDDVFFQLRPNEAHGRVFVINSVTGDISITGESQLDYDEGLQVYNLIVETAVGLFSPTAIVSIFLADVNDNAPRFELATYLGVVLENQPPGTLVTNVTADDIDSGANGEFFYFISDSINFRVDQVTGEVVTLRLLDREALPTDSVTVTALDSGTPPLSSTAIVSVTITDQNDVAPRFLQDLYILNINNVSPAGTQLLTLTIDDPDTVGEFAFRIITNSSEEDVLELFTVLSPEGILAQRSVGIPSDHSLLYSFTVEVNDGIRTATTDIIINIVTVTTATLHILENQTYSFDLKGFLRERGFNFASDVAIFSFLSGNELLDFTISPDGILSTEGLDREFVAEYHLNINVTDPSSGEVANVLVNIDVEDVNDHAPVFPGGYVYHINETTYVTATFLGMVEATDMDDPTTRNARLQYSLLVPNNDGFSLTLDGQLYVRGTFDREDRDQYTFTVRAEDFGEPDQEYGYVSVTVYIGDRNDNNPQFVPADVVEFYVQVEISDKVVIGPDSILDGIVAVLPVANLTVELNHFTFSDPDTTSTVTATLSLVSGTDKYKLERSEEDMGGESYMLVVTDYIKPDDHGTVLQITLTDEPKEKDPIIRNVTIVVTEIIETTETPVTDKPTKEGVVPTTDGDDFFTTEIGIAIIVVLVLLGVAIMILFGCLVLYCVVKYRRSKDPLNAKDRFISVAQRIQETSGHKGRKPWQYFDYSDDMDLLEYPDTTAEERDANFMYGADAEHESTFMSDDPYTTDVGSPEPFSTGTSILSSLHQSYKEQEEEEDEEDVRTYSMGPILRAMLEEFERGDSVLKRERKKSRSKHSLKHNI